MKKVLFSLAAVIFACTVSFAQDSTKMHHTGMQHKSMHSGMHNSSDSMHMMHRGTMNNGTMNNGGMNNGGMNNGNMSNGAMSSGSMNNGKMHRKNSPNRRSQDSLRLQKNDFMGRENDTIGKPRPQ